MNHEHLALRSLNLDGRRGLALLLASLLLLLPTLAGEAGRALLRYELSALADGEWWRLLSAHLVHLDLRHALLNVVGLVLVWALFARDYSPKAWLAIVLGHLTRAVLSALRFRQGKWRHIAVNIEPAKS